MLLGRKAMTNLDSILKSRDITLPTNVRLVKAMVFPVVMYEYESWTIKKVEHQRIDDFKLWCWRRLLTVPWTARRCKQSILKEISPEYSLEGLMLKLKLQYFGCLMRRADLLEKTLMLGKIEGGRRRGWQRMRWLDDITDSMDMIWVGSESWWWTGKPGVLQPMGPQKVGHDWMTELNWWWFVGFCHVGHFLFLSFLLCLWILNQHPSPFQSYEGAMLWKSAPGFSSRTFFCFKSLVHLGFDLVFMCMEIYAFQKGIYFFPW